MVIKFLCHKVNNFLLTAINIIDPMPLNIEVVDIDKYGINISWSEEPMFAASHAVGHAYLLTITNGSNREIVPLNESYYYFRAPSNAYPCEVYNFSVTATPVGATYTGDGCSVPSPMLSRMLPSLPDITRLESTLNYSLLYKRSPMAEFELSIQFMVRKHFYSYFQFLTYRSASRFL